MMSQQIDEKRHLIIPILDQLRVYKPAIGSYIKSLYTADFDYSVKLSNGRIRLPEELIDDYERDPWSVTAARFQNAANRFTPDEMEPPAKNQPVVREPVQPAPPQQNVSRSTFGWRTVVIALLLLGLGYYWYQSAQKSDAENTARANIYRLVSLEGSNYTVNKLFGGIKDLRLTVVNNSGYLVDMVKVKVSYIKTAGGIYKEEMVYFNRVYPHATMTLNAPESDRGTSVKVEMVSLTCSALNL